jgi:hypothetical protein
MISRSLRSFAKKLGPAACLFLVLPVLASAQDSTATPHGRGRKYKPPPETSHIEVLVTKGYNHKPIENAAVIFHELREDGKDEGNLEVKTDPDGKAVIDVIPTGANVRVQVIANGFATFAQDFVVSEASRQIPVTMIRPREQISNYVDNSGKPATIQPGVQEPIRPKADTTPGATTAPTPAPAPAPSPAPKQ